MTMIQVPVQNNIPHKREQVINVQRQHGLQTVHKRGKETQEHLEKCNFTKDMRKNIDLNIREDKIVPWRKIARAFKDTYEPKKRKF